MIEETTNHITTGAVLKHLGYIPAIMFGVSTDSYAILAFFILLDTLTGVLRAGILHGWREVTSFKFTTGLISKLLVIFIPLMIALAGKGVGLNLTILAQSAIGMLILAQFYSILGNIHAIKIRKDVKEFDAVSWVITHIQEVVEKLLVDSNKGKR